MDWLDQAGAWIALEVVLRGGWLALAAIGSMVGGAVLGTLMFGRGYKRRIADLERKLEERNQQSIQQGIAIQDNHGTIIMTPAPDGGYEVRGHLPPLPPAQRFSGAGEASFAEAEPIRIGLRLGLPEGDQS